MKFISSIQVGHMGWAWALKYLSPNPKAVPSKYLVKWLEGTRSGTSSSNRKCVLGFLFVCWGCGGHNCLANPETNQQWIFHRRQAELLQTNSTPTLSRTSFRPNSLRLMPRSSLRYSPLLPFFQSCSSLSSVYSLHVIFG